MNAKYLIDFEKEIEEIYESGKIKAPVHLRNNNEADLCAIFKNHKVKKEDYLFFNLGEPFSRPIERGSSRRSQEENLRGQVNNPALPRTQFL